MRQYNGPAYSRLTSRAVDLRPLEPGADPGPRPENATG